MSPASPFLCLLLLVEVPSVLAAGHAERSTVAGLACSGGRTHTVTVCLTGQSAPQPAITVVRDAAWSPADAARDGASELSVLLTATRLLSESALVGLVGVGNRHGAFLPPIESALQRTACLGLPVVRVAGTGVLPANPDDLFIEAGALDAPAAQSLLRQCLLHHGTLPPAADPAAPTARELKAIRTKLALYQREFDTHSGRQLAVR